MLRRLWSPRSLTPVTGIEAVRIQPGRRSVHRSVTVHAPSPSVNSYSHVLRGTPKVSTSKANRRPGSADVTVTVVLHRRHPARLLPRNFVPAAGPVAPPSPLPPVFSGLHSPMRGKSVTSSYSRAASALTVSETSTSDIRRH